MSVPKTSLLYKYKPNWLIIKGMYMDATEECTWTEHYQGFCLTKPVFYTTVHKTINFNRVSHCWTLTPHHFVDCTSVQITVQMCTVYTY